MSWPVCYARFKISRLNEYNSLNVMIILFAIHRRFEFRAIPCARLMNVVILSVSHFIFVFLINRHNFTKIKLILFETEISYKNIFGQCSHSTLCALTHRFYIDQQNASIDDRI